MNMEKKFNSKYFHIYPRRIVIRTFSTFQKKSIECQIVNQAVQFE